MSALEFTKDLTVNDSNIPIPKRNLKGIKKTKVTSQLPELQKYIETIIKASNECELEDTSISEKDKFPKERNFGRQTVYKGFNNKIKHEKVKFDLNMNKRKYKNMASLSEAVSTDVDISKSFSQFEDPRNWIFDKTQSLRPNLEIVHFLKKIYPNPYRTENLYELRTGLIFENVKTDGLRDGTLADVIISKVETEVDIEKRNSTLVIADNEIKPCVRENIPHSLNQFPSFESINPQVRNNNDNVFPKTLPTLKKACEISNSTSNVSSQNSSRESAGPCKRNLNDLKKKKYIKTRRKLSKDVLSKSESKIFSDNVNDYDIGKLNLLNTSDSNDSDVNKLNTEIKTTRTEDNESEKLEDLSKRNDLRDLLQIYNVMNKATESYLMLSSKTESNYLIANTAQKAKKQLNFYSNFVEGTLEVEQKSKNNAEEQLNEKKLENRSVNKEEELKNNALPDEASENEETVGKEIKVSTTSKNFPKDHNFDTEKKIDEVLEFMFECLKKFKSQEKLLLKKDTKATLSFNKDTLLETKSQILKKTHKTDDKDKDYAFTNNFTNDTKDEIQNKHIERLEEIKRKPVSKIRYNRKSEIFTTNIELTESKVDRISYSSHQIPVTCSRTILPENLDHRFVPDSTVISNENLIQTVESQNELGGYAEQSNALNGTAHEGTKSSKSVFPMSIKAKKIKIKTEAFTTLKDVLETEEKLLVNEAKETEKKPSDETKNFITYKPQNQMMIKNESKSSYSLTGGFKHPNSKFVICVNSYPRALRSIKPNITLPASLTFSTTDIRPWDLKPLTYYPRSKSKKLPIQFETELNVVELGCNVKEEVLVTINRSIVKCIAVVMGLKTITSFPKQEDFSITMSERTIKIKPLKKSILVESNIAAMNTSLFKSTLTIKSSKSNFISSSESVVSIKAGDKLPVKTLIEAFNETQEEILLLQQSNELDKHSKNEPQSLCSCSANDLLQTKISENGNDKKKIHDLLLRTYNLQQKLHHYLHQITYVQSTSSTCPFIQHEPFLDFGLFLKDKPDLSWSEFNVQSNNALPQVHWYFETPVSETNSKMDEAVTVNVQMVDDSTSYNPPTEENYEVEKSENDNDDNSSTYSFKSSNDFSEDAQNITKELSYERNNETFVKQLLDKIDFYEKNFESNKPKAKSKSEEENLEMIERIENKLVEYDFKTPAKVLKTVFKGKDSSTELTIGLKDVPMTKVNNISVEKTKYSPNHTKISICISKERTNTPKQSTKEVIQNEFPSYYLKNTKPSLSTCQTECSRLEVDMNRNSNGDSEDDDDYQSVASTIDNADSDADEDEKSTINNSKTAKASLQKNFTKHRFNFYKKMELDLDDNKTKKKSFFSPLYRYKELEPLKEALTEMQMRMRNIKRDALLSSNDYYERALKLAKMSAGFCQNCGNRTVIPKDTLGYYKTLIPRKYIYQKRSRHLRPLVASKSNFYSFRASNADFGNHLCDLDVKHSSSCLLNRTSQTNRTVFRTSFHDMPILFERT